MKMGKDYKGFLELVAKVAKIDADAALYLVKMSAMSKNKRKKLDFGFRPYLGEVMTWNKTKQGFTFWCDLGKLIPTF